MRYISRDKLSVIELEKSENIISFDMLVPMILKKPSNMIYCEVKGLLCGLISMGDIARASKDGKAYVMINKNFMCVLSNENMKARKIFYDKIHINALPVVNKEGVLLGAYIRWDDNNAGTWEFSGGIQKIHDRFHNIFLVNPCSECKENLRLFEVFRDYLLSQKLKIKCIEYCEIINYLAGTNWILFVNEDELRAIYTLYTYIWNKDLNETIFCTFYHFVKECSYEVKSGILKNIMEMGVHVFNLVWENTDKNKNYQKKLKMDIVDKYTVIGQNVSGRLYTSMYKDFFDDIYSKDYANSIMNINYQIETQSGCGRLRDCKSKVYNVVNGERFTYGQPQDYNKTIWFVGACFLYGHYSEDKKTIESFLQARLNERGYKIKVVNCSSPAYASHIDLILARILTLPLRKGDIIVCGHKGLRGIEKINLMDVCYEYGISAEWMVDHPAHCNHKLHSIYADAILEHLKSVLQQKFEEQGRLLESDENFIKMLYIDWYFKKSDFSRFNKIGSIVMNSNPFTYGHRYLIEQALEQVDFLVIFVVEEDGSLFSFDERFAMVCEGVVDINNVMVVPSGSFILSKTTFPEYFIKSTDKFLVENVENDIKIFAKYIAHYINISYRFVGEEPEDTVTAVYNKAMRKILPENGIEFVEIPRKKQDGRYISASAVRKSLEEYDLQSLRKLVPRSTMELLSLPVF